MRGAISSVPWVQICLRIMHWLEIMTEMPVAIPSNCSSSSAMLYDERKMREVCVEWLT